MNKIQIDSNIIRAVWSSVEAINHTALLQLNDTDLIRQVMQRVESISILTAEERQSLNKYITSKVLLIRELTNS